MYIINGELTTIDLILRKLKWKQNAEQEEVTSEPIKGIYENYIIQIIQIIYK